ncbi:MAG TPA: acyl-CoA dehydrogenase family protein, partial [Candidatus Binatia bacterium]|nr:acyl-CoA dehydrogenase family protein [Candidatus Binatia bacterium]
MSDAKQQRVTTEQESREVAEQARQTEWEGRAFIRELYLGGLPLDLVHPFPTDEADRPEFRKFYDGMRDFLNNDVDSVAIDQTGEYTEAVIDGLRKLGAFGMKVPKEYGGLGLTVSEYCRIMEMIGSSDGNIAALLSAHQSIG